MLKFISKRLAQTLIVLLGVTFITFTLLFVIPGDPVNIMLEKRADPATIARVRAQLGLDRPYLEQYGDFLQKAVRGDLGKSYFEQRPVATMLKEGFEVTARLAIYSLIFALSLGLIIGIISALYRGRFLDRSLMAFTMLGMSAPSFWISIILQLYFGLKLGLLPISGIDSSYAYVLPTIALGTRFAASIARITRTSMLESMMQDYIRTAKAKGLSQSAVVLKHGLRNAAIPILTYLGLSVKALLGGSVLVETVFSLPGIGKLMIGSVGSRDIPVVQACTIYIASVFVLVNLFVDLLYGVLDPRVRLKKG